MVVGAAIDGVFRRTRDREVVGAVITEALLPLVEPRENLRRRVVEASLLSTPIDPDRAARQAVAEAGTILGSTRLPWASVLALDLEQLIREDAHKSLGLTDFLNAALSVLRGAEVVEEEARIRLPDLEVFLSSGPGWVLSKRFLWLPLPGVKLTEECKEQVGETLPIRTPATRVKRVWVSSGGADA